MNLNELSTALRLLLKDTKSGGMSKKVKASSFSAIFKEMYSYIPGADFSFKGLPAPDYTYVHNNKEFRENRMKFQKHKLVQEGYPEELSEADIMKIKQYYKVYGCGNAIYEWRKE